MRALAFLLAVALAPGFAEATEDFAHWFAEGHTVHASAEEHAATGEDPFGEGAGTDEHGCTALFHLCGCHSPAPSMVTAPLMFAAHDDVPLVSVASGFAHRSRRALDGVYGEAFRPPIA